MMKQLEGFTPVQLAEFWCIFNRWDWPKEIPNPEPVLDPIMKCFTPRRDVYLKEITELVGHKLCLRVGNKDRMNDEEFEDFWAGNYEGDRGAKYRDSARSWAKVLMAEYKIVEAEAV